MKKIIMSGVIAYAFALLPLQMIQAQSTNYLSNLGQPSAGNLAVGSDSWWAVMFNPGYNNPSGYMLNSIQLGMADATGSPTNFSVMLYAGGTFPYGNSLGSSIATLEGSLSPVLGNIYTYTPTSNITLFGSYILVVTAGTAVADGAYEWSYTTNLTSGTGGWSTYQNGEALHTDGVVVYHIYPGEFPQFAINVTDVPEPGAWALSGLGALVFLWHRRKAKAIE